MNRVNQVNRDFASRLLSSLRSKANVLPPSILFVLASSILFILCWASFFNGLEILYPLDKTEALQLELARQMSVTGDLITPSMDGNIYFDKPPLPYWIGSFLLRDADQFWLPRIGSAVAGSVGVVATFFLCLYSSLEPIRMRLIRSASAAAILMLMPFYSGFSRVALHDIYLTASITIALAIIFLHSQAQRHRYSLSIVRGLIVGCALGAGMLAKGLLAPVLTLAIAIIFLFLAGPVHRKKFGWAFVLSMLIGFSLIACPWHLAAWHANGENFINIYFGRTQLNRFASELDNHSGPWFFYLLFYPAITLPWFFPAAFELLRSNVLALRLMRQKAASYPLESLSAIWIVTTIGLLSVASTKLPHYILPSLPPTAIVASYFFFPLRSDLRHAQRFSKTLLLITGLILVVASLLLFFSPELLIRISKSSPTFSLALRDYLSSYWVTFGFLLLGLMGCFAGIKTSFFARFWLGGFWALCITCFFLFISPQILGLYYLHHQLPRLQLADQALLEARDNSEPIQVIGKSWYSVKIRTRGRAEILEKGKAFKSTSDNRSSVQCRISRLILGPAPDIQREAKRCPSNSLTILQQGQLGRLSLARLAPS